MKRYVIDVREPDEFASGHAKEAVNIPLSELLSGSKQLTDMPKSDELILYCNSGRRSGAAKKIIESMGYTNVINGINQKSVSARKL